MESDLTLEQGPLRGNILVRVFSFLRVTDKQNVAQVCHYWKNLVYAPVLWNEATADLPYNPSKSLIISLKKREIARLTCSRTTDEELSYLFSELPCLTRLKIKDSRQVSHEFLKTKLPTLSRLEHLHITYCPQVDLEKLYSDQSFAKVLKKLKSLEIPQKIPANDFKKLVCKLKSLEDLDLKDCEELNDECLESISKACPKLQCLSLGFRPWFSDTGLAMAVRKLKKLKNLDLSWNFGASGDTIVIVADNLPDLESFHFENIQYLSNETVTYVAKKLKKLKNLSFSGIMPLHVGCGYEEDQEGDATDLEAMFKELSQLKNLESLKFKVTDGEISESHVLSLAQNLPKLKELEVKGLDKITNKQATQIAKFLPNLESFEIKMKKKSQGGISLCSQLKGLKSLDFSGCRINDKDLKVMLPNLANLESLTSLNNPGVTDSGMAHIANHLKSLTTLFLSGKVGDTGVAVLAEGLPQLQSLIFSGCRQITSQGAKMIGKHMKQLQYLRVQKTKIDDEGFVFLCLNLPNLRTLDASYCPLTNQGMIDGAVGLGNLESLEIGSQKISNEGIKKSAMFLKGLTHMRIVSAHLISKDAVVSMLEDLPHLTSLEFSGCGQMCMQERLVRPLCNAAGVNLNIYDLE